MAINGRAFKQLRTFDNAVKDLEGSFDRRFGEGCYQILNPNNTKVIVISTTPNSEFQGYCLVVRDKQNRLVFSDELGMDKSAPTRHKALRWATIIERSLRFDPAGRQKIKGWFDMVREDINLGERVKVAA